MTSNLIFISIVCATTIFLGGYTVYQNHFYLNCLYTDEEKQPLRDVVREIYPERKWKSRYIEISIMVLEIGWPLVTIAFIVMFRAMNDALGIWISLIGLALTALVHLMMRLHLGNMIKMYAVKKVEEKVRADKG